MALESARPRQGGQGSPSHGGSAAADARASGKPRASSQAAGNSPPRLSKLRPPRPHVAVVPRRRVVSALLGATEPVVLLCAAAGSGKTVAATQWAARESRPVAWLHLDAYDNDPVVFLTYVGAALDGVVAPHSGLGGVLRRRRRAPRREQLLAGIVSTVTEADPFVLVLDDCHLVQNADCWGCLDALVEALAEGATLALCTRSEPPLSLGRLRAQGRLGELRQAQFAFDHDETKELLRLHGVDADDGAVRALVELTEGWATGMYLGLLAARDRPGADWLAEVRGDQQAISAFLLDEVLRQQPPDLQLFLEQTSILEELSAPLCAAVTGRAGAGAVLEHLAHDNLFVSALDDHGERYRYHHLFAELLRSRLEQQGEAEAGRLHHLAAAWCRGQRRPEAAVRHYLAAGDVEATVDLAALTADTLLVQGYVESARRLLQLYTDEQLLAYPALAIAAGWVFALAAGTPEEQRLWARRIVALEFEDGPTPLDCASLRSSWLVVVGELAPEGLKQARRCFEEALSLERPRAGDWRAMAWDDVARTRYLCGAAERARRMYEEGLSAETGAQAVAELERSAGTRSWLALIAEDAGRWDEASELMAEAERLRPHMGFDEAPHHSGWLPMLYARLRLMSHAGDPGTMAFAHAIDEFAADMVHNAPWVLLMRDVVLGEVALEQGDLAAARGWCDRALRVLAGWPDAGVYGRRARQLADALERRADAEPLSPAEKRVLAEMPSYLTVGEIAEQLHLSRNTVKTHLAVIYRKLQVSSRGGAVAKARTLGLLVL